MKRKFGKILSVMLAVLVVIACTCVLFACHKDKDKDRDAEERRQSVASVKHSILHAVDGEWGGSLTDEEVVRLDNAGDYVVAEGWASFICDVFLSSSLQTGKLKTLSGAVASEDGQKLLADFNDNFELLIPIMRQADFTATDISSLFYSLLCSLASNGDKTLQAMAKRLSDIKNMPTITSAARANVQQRIIDVDLIRSNLLPDEQEKQAMLSAFEKAKAPMSELVEFAYNVSLGSVTDNVFDALFGDSGALENISDEEINTIVTAILRNLTELKNAFDDEAIENMNSALELVIANFDTTAVTSTIYQQVVQYAKYTYKLVDFIPVACDVMYSAGGIFADTVLLRQLRGVIGKELNSNANTVNMSIMLAKILLKIGEDFKKEQLLALVDEIGVQSSGDYQKKVPLVAIDLALNVSSAFSDSSEIDFDNFTYKHDGILNGNDFRLMVGSISMTLAFDNFKKTYADYKNGTASFSQLKTAESSCNFANLGIVNEFSAGTEAWYNYYTVTAVGIINQKIEALSGRCVEDLKAYVNDFYAEGSESKALVQEIANWSFKEEDMPNSELDPVVAKLLSSDLYGLVVLCSLIFAE